MRAPTKKNAGKFILITCGVLVVLFLLLPFLQPQNQEADGKSRRKASPQIFTSNPLTNLVNKLYAMFDKNSASKRSSAQRQASAQEQAEQQLALANAEAQARNALQREEAARNAADPFDPSSVGPGANAPRSFQPDGQPSDEDWVLVRQTAPEGAARGMHDISTNDNAYDKLVNQERVARYIPGPSAPRQQMPDSKLARLFRPINNVVHKWFGGEGVNVSGATGEENLMASAGGPTSGLGTGGNGSYGRGNTVDGMGFGASGATQGMANAYQNKNSGVTLSDLFNPLASIEKDMDSWYVKDKDGNVSKEDSESRKAILEELGRQWQQELKRNRDELEKAAEASNFIVRVQDTIHCGSASAMYKTAQVCEYENKPQTQPAFSMALKSITPTVQVSAPATQEDIAAQRQKSLQAYREVMGGSLQREGFNMVVVLGKNDNAEVQRELNHAAGSPASGNEDMQLAHELYQFMMEKQKCDQQDCFWVANSLNTKELHEMVSAAGGQFKGDPMKVYQDLYGQFVIKKLDETSGSEKFLDLQQKLPKISFPYVAYNAKQFAEMNKRNLPEEAVKNPNNSFIPFVATASNAKEMMDSKTMPNPLLTIYDKKTDVLNEDSGLNSAQRGDKVKEIIVERMEEVQGLTQTLKRLAAQRYINAQTKQTEREVNNQMKTQLKTLSH